MIRSILQKISIFSFGISMLSYATAAPAASTPTSYLPDTRVLQDLCPPVESLKQNPDTTWSAAGGWKSNSPSLMNSVSHFVGAQWVGINVGEVICMYSKGSGQNRFPITLQRHNVILSPDGGHWTADKGGHKDCLSTDIRQCRFFSVQKMKPKNIYDELDFYKDKVTDDNS